MTAIDMTLLSSYYQNEIAKVSEARAQDARLRQDAIRFAAQINDLLASMNIDAYKACVDPCCVVSAEDYGGRRVTDMKIKLCESGLWRLYIGGKETGAEQVDIASFAETFVKSILVIAAKSTTSG